MKTIFLFYKDFLQPTPLGVGLTNKKRVDLNLTKLNSTDPLGVGLTNRKRVDLNLTKLNSTDPLGVGLTNRKTLYKNLQKYSDRIKELKRNR